MALSLTTAPTAEPITLAELKDHLQITWPDEDAYLENFVLPTARQMAETITHRALITQTYTLKLGSFGTDVIVLPRPPLSSVSSIQYVDNAGSTQTWSAASYTVETPSGERALHATIQPAFNEVYPTTRAIVEAVTITFVAGYGAASSVPKGIKHGILMLAEDLYTSRGGQIVGLMRTASLTTAETVLGPYIAWRDDIRYD